MKPLALIHLALALMISLLASSGAAAHEIRPAYLKLTQIEGSSDYAVVWKQPLRDGKRLEIEPVFPPACQEVSRSLGQSTGSALIQRWRMTCADEGLQNQTLLISGLDRTIVDVFVEVSFASGRIQSRILKPNAASFVVSEAGGSAASRYLRLGIEHLLSGFDHILFVIGLVLLIRTPMNLVKVVTSFTIAHSLTLALATYGLVRLSPPAVEAVIALSIMFLAVELVRARNAGGMDESIIMRYPWAITFVFGLLHGFGFAGALTQIGLPREAAALALFLFNVGVEVGQLLIVAAALCALALFRRLPVTWPAPAGLMPAYIIGTMAAYWFVERTLSVF